MPGLTRKLAVALMLVALSLDLVGGRWAAYLRSPIHGIYLPDFIFILGLFFSMIYPGSISRFFRGRYAIPVLLSVVFVFGKLGWSLLVDHQDLNLAVRDGAPLFFMSTAPFVGSVFDGPKLNQAIRIVRWTSTAYLALFLMVCVGILTPFSSDILGTRDARILEYGGDLIGVMIGVSYLSWSTRYVNFKFSYLVRVLILGLIFLHNSRGGLLATFTMVFLGLFSINKSIWKREILVVGVGFVIAVFVQKAAVISSYYGAPFYGPHINPENMAASADVKNNTALHKISSFSSFYSMLNNSTGYKNIKAKEDITYFVPEWTSPSLQNFIEHSGTIGGRISTWLIVTEYLVKKNMWLVGANYGSDILQISCSNPNLPTYNTAWPGGGIEGPKCPIDSNETTRAVRDSHNFLVTIFTYNGLIGLLLFVSMIISYFISTEGVDRQYRTLLILFLIGYGISGLFSTFASYPFVLVPSAIFLGLMQSKRENA